MPKNLKIMEKNYEEKKSQDRSVVGERERRYYTVDQKLNYQIISIDS